MTDEGVHKLGEVLRTAREAKGVDLTRVERDTKIRERYLSALERGEYRELPGAVYTKGFLRNYGAYLGLDPEYLIDLYRLEATGGASERPTAPVPPRPIAVRRSRSLVVSPGAVVGAILTLLVGALVVWIGYEFFNFARTPELRILEPPGNVSAHVGDTITISGVTAANATVTVSGLPENPTVTADPDGDFEVTVGLLPGSNVIELTAHDPVTERDSVPVVRTVQVVAEVGASPSPTVDPLALAQPAADATITGPVAVAGTGAPGSTLQLTAALIGAADADLHRDRCGRGRGRRQPHATDSAGAADPGDRCRRRLLRQPLAGTRHVGRDCGADGRRSGHAARDDPARGRAERYPAPGGRTVLPGAGSGRRAGRRGIGQHCRGRGQHSRSPPRKRCGSGRAMRGRRG